MRPRIAGNRRGGVLLDAVLALALLLVGAYLLHSAGLTFHELVHGAAQFFGVG